MGYKAPEWWQKDLTNRLITFAGCGTWRVGQKLREKQDRVPHHDDNDYAQEWEPSEVNAVYECVQVESETPGKSAILKVRIQWVLTTLNTLAL